MFQNWFYKREVKKALQGCDFQKAQHLLIKKFAGGVIPIELGQLLDAYTDNPCLDTAIGLIRYDVKFLAVFDLAKPGLFTDELFKDYKPDGR